MQLSHLLGVVEAEQSEDEHKLDGVVFLEIGDLG
jgi:hypothetical protein